MSVMIRRSEHSNINQFKYVLFPMLESTSRCLSSNREILVIYNFPGSLASRLYGILGFGFLQKVKGNAAHG